MTINYAHRGASGIYPENTMVAFEKALELGCGGIETDVQMTKDGVLVLMHDEEVGRTTSGNGYLKDYEHSALKRLDAGSWKNPKFSKEYIPTAQDLINLTKGTEIIINFELKTGIIQYEGIEEALIELIYKNGIENKVLLSSFNHYSIVHCKEISSEIKTGLLYSEGLYKPEYYAKYVGADALHPHFYAVNASIIKAAKENNIVVNTYTVNDEINMRKLLKLDVDGIITNYPDRLKTVIDEG